MTTNGPRMFRSALLIEAAANIGTIIPLILVPKTCLSPLVESPSQITPAALALTQWLGAIIVVPTVPLLIAHADPTASQPPSLVTARRRMTYLLLGAGEIALGSLTAGQYLLGDSGISDTALLVATGMMFSLASWRSYCLFVKPEWVEAQSAVGRSK